MCENINCLFTFSGVRSAIKAEELCKNGGVLVQVVTIPTYISSECGMALKVSGSDKAQVVELLSDQNIEFSLHNI